MTEYMPPEQVAEIRSAVLLSLNEYPDLPALCSREEMGQVLALCDTVDVLRKVQEPFIALAKTLPPHLTDTYEVCGGIGKMAAVTMGDFRALLAAGGKGRVQDDGNKGTTAD